MPPVVALAYNAWSTATLSNPAMLVSLTLFPPSITGAMRQVVKSRARPESLRNWFYGAMRRPHAAKEPGSIPLRVYAPHLARLCLIEALRHGTQPIHRAPLKEHTPTIAAPNLCHRPGIQ